MKNPFSRKETINKYTGEVGITDIAPIFCKIITTVTKKTYDYISKFRMFNKEPFEVYNRDNYCNVSLEFISKFTNLSSPARKLVDYIVHNLQFNTNHVRINFNDIKNLKLINDNNSIYKAIKELVECNLIKEVAGNDGLYSVNHNYIFIGDYNKFIDRVRETYNVNDDEEIDSKYYIIIEDKYVGRIRKHYYDEYSKSNN